MNELNLTYITIFGDSSNASLQSFLQDGYLIEHEEEVYINAEGNATVRYLLAKEEMNKAS